MKKMLCIRAKLKKGSISGVREWFETLKSRYNETVQTLENEGIIVESVFLDRIGEDDFLIYYMRADDIDKAIEIYNKSTAAIDIYHKENWRKFSEERVALEPLLDIDRIALPIS
jgi:hypothetical protein